MIIFLLEKNIFHGNYIIKYNFYEIDKVVLLAWEFTTVLMVDDI